jgi:hypothetical protein
MTNTDKIVQYILDHEKDLPAEKITAMSNVIKALGGEVEPPAPNEVAQVDDPNLIDEEAPLDLSRVKKIQIDGTSQPVKIYNN